MKKPLVTLGVVTGCVILLLAVFAHTQPHRRWHALPNGDTTRVFTVTCGTDHRPELPTRSWSSHYRKLFSNRFSLMSLYGVVQRPHGWARASSSTPSLVIWFQTNSIGVTSFDATLVTRAGQRYRTKAANGASTDGFAYTGLQFPVVPSDPMLHLEVSIDGAPIVIEIPNPAANPTGNPL